MSNAMKKLKLLHHLTAASANATSTAGNLPPSSTAVREMTSQQQQQQQPTPPTSPMSRPEISSARMQNNYNEMAQALRSARQALNMLNSPPAPPAPQPYLQQQESYRPSPYMHHQPQKAPTCLLPQAFMVLTPNDPHPAICLPASPPPPQPSYTHHNYHHHHSSSLIPPIQINPPIQQVLLSEQAVPRGNTTIYSSRPPVAPSPPVASYHSYHNSLRRKNSQKRQRLTSDAVSKIGKDSRLARWERVVGYVRDQRKSNPAVSSPSTIDPVSSSNIISEIERKNKILDLLDMEEQQARSLWSGGSGGTNGVDEFVWSEDEDDDDFRKDIGSQQVLEDHKRRLDAMYSGEGVKEMIAQADEVAVFELEDHDEATVKDFEMDIVEDKKRPKSSPIGALDAKADGVKEYLEMLKTGMPELRRETELEGGLDRLIGRDMRRFSAVY